MSSMSEPTKEPSLRTYRFRAYLVGSLMLLVVGHSAMIMRVDSVLAGVVLGAIVTFCGAYIGFGSIHDRDVRMARRIQQKIEVATGGTVQTTETNVEASAA